MNCLRFCKFYARGACLKGDQCDFAHEKKDDVRCNSNSGFHVLRLPPQMDLFVYFPFVSYVENRFAAIIRKDSVHMVVDADISMSKLPNRHLQQMDAILLFWILW